MFETIKPGQPDPMNLLKTAADGDQSPQKIDVGVGVYRNEGGGYHEFWAVKEAKKILDAENSGHDYGPTTGCPKFTKLAAELMFGPESEVLRRVTSVQTISGTGANHLAALFLSRTSRDNGVLPKVYIGTPTWGNYEPLFTLTDFEVEKYTYYDFGNHCINFENIMATVNGAPNGGIFVLQACCHNPTGADLSTKEWRILAAAMQDRGHFPFFDIAYMGLGNGLDGDAYAVRLFAEMGFEMAVCQSFSKNFGLYGERVGSLHIVCPDETIAANVKDQVRNLIRWEFSSSPAYGARLVTIILSNTQLEQCWRDELQDIRNRLNGIRRTFVELLKRLQIPGDWKFIEQEKGLFSLLPLKPASCKELTDQHHVYLAPNGRITISGLSKKNMRLFAEKIDHVLRRSR